MAASADIQEPRLSAGTEAFIGSIICPVGKHGFWGNKPIQRDAFHLARTLVNQLQRSVEGVIKTSVNLLKLVTEIKVNDFYLQASGL